MTRLLKLREAAAILSVHRKTLEHYIQARKVASVRLPGGHLRIEEDELERFVSSRKFGMDVHHGK